MTHQPDGPLAVVGAGYMAREYAKALRALGADFTVHGRGADSAARFEAETGLRVSTGPLAAQFGEGRAVPARAIVAVTTDSLAPVTRSLLDLGVGRILLEKPGGLTPEEIADLAAHPGADRVAIAYNRRFYPSVERARALIAEDGGVASFAFEFTELSDRIRQTAHAAPLKRTWFYGNSSHVVDLAFYLAGASGDPAAIDFAAALVDGAIDWHPAAARFAGCGRIAGGPLFTYKADWESGGRWAVEMNTRRRRLILAPLETLAMQMRGSFAVEPVADLPAEPAAGLKPGLAAMLTAFLSDAPDAPDDRLLPLIVQAKRIAAFSRMLRPA
jgi:predicted dehydrogenase